MSAGDGGQREGGELRHPPPTPGRAPGVPGELRERGGAGGGDPGAGPGGRGRSPGRLPSLARRRGELPGAGARGLLPRERVTRAVAAGARAGGGGLRQFLPWAGSRNEGVRRGARGSRERGHRPPPGAGQPDAAILQAGTVARPPLLSPPAGCVARAGRAEPWRRGQSCSENGRAGEGQSQACPSSAQARPGQRSARVSRTSPVSEPSRGGRRCGIQRGKRLRSCLPQSPWLRFWHKQEGAGRARPRLAPSSAWQAWISAGVRFCRRCELGQTGRKISCRASRNGCSSLITHTAAFLDSFYSAVFSLRKEARSTSGQVAAP